MKKRTMAAGLPMFARLANGESAAGAVQVALVGYGWQGVPLLEAFRGLDGARLVAVADIWPYAVKAAQERARSLGWEVRGYASLAELLAAEGERVDAVVVATPDWQHANHIAACLAAGKHVYCEGELADSVEKARELVAAARTADRLVQGGHRRRSNPRYIHAVENLCQGHQGLGRVTTAYAQWHRPVRSLRAVPARLALPTEVLEANGYANMEAFLNWQWFRKYGWGLSAALAGQKLDVMRWFAGTEPVSVAALGDSGYYGRETEDSLMALVTFANSGQDRLRGYVQIVNNASRGGSYEQFFGEYAALTIAEIAACGDFVQPEESYVMRDEDLRKKVWYPHVKAGRILPLRQPPKKEDTQKPVVDVRVSPNAPGWPLPIRLDKPVAQPHLANFVAAVRGEAQLTDPAEQAYRNLVCMDAVMRALRGKCTVRLAPEEFKI